MRRVFLTFFARRCDNYQRIVICVSSCKVCEYVREDNVRALASGLSPVHAHNHTITALHQHTCVLCAL